MDCITLADGGDDASNKALCHDAAVLEDIESHVTAREAIGGTA